MLKADKSYILDVSQVKNSGSTSIKLKKAFMDLQNINVTYSVSGTEKVVAIELKRNLNDEKTINKVTGLWVGRRWLSEHSLIGMSYYSDGFIDPLFLVFHMSDGQNAAFEIRDRVGIKEIGRASCRERV